MLTILTSILRLEEEILDRFPTETRKKYIKYCNSKVSRNQVKRKMAIHASNKETDSTKAKVLCKLLFLIKYKYIYLKSYLEFLVTLILIYIYEFNRFRN